MLDRQTFNPRDPRYKTPFGATPAGAAVTLSLRPPRAAGYSGCEMTVRYELRGDAKKTLSLPWTGMDGSRDVFSAVLQLDDYVGLVWYSFRLYGFHGRERRSAEYQLTVFDGAASAVPEWFGAGVCYQIFPDRFHRSRIPDPTGLVGNRTVHHNWNDAPEYRPDENGEVRNRDFFGGDLAGIIQKLDYIQSLGTETIYFCPLFEAAENHRYGTADYEKIDPMLGTEDDFTRLCREAKKRGMRVMLDGVFNHVGYRSKYFNGDGFYGTGGAAQDQNSPYSRWFQFKHWPDQYEAWWDFYSLPAIQEEDESYRAYMFGKDGIIRRWLRAGAAGWRLDVADELPDSFVAELNRAARAEKPDAVVIGEVWEDGSTKIAYGVRRRHVLGGHCDGLMNYPLRVALIDYLLHGRAEAFRERMETLRENYPREMFYSCMNALGTHDTPRILTLLGVGSACAETPKSWRADYRMTAEQRARGLALLRVGMTALYAFPGSPTVYYGDEVGMEGFEDPFNRAPFPWGGEDESLHAHFCALGAARRTLAPLRSGELRYLVAEGPILVFARETKESRVIAALNSGEHTKQVTIEAPSLTDLLTGEVFGGREGSVEIPLSPYSGRLLR